MMFRAAPACIISTAQHARPNVTGHSDPVLDQLISLSRLVVTKPSSKTPSITLTVRTSRLSFPVQRALFPFVDKSDRQNGQEQHHPPEAGAPRAQIAQGRAPRKQERDFQVEQDEQDRYQVIPDVELHSRIFERFETALVGRQFLRVRAVRTEQHADRDWRDTDDRADDQEQQDRQVAFKIQAIPAPLVRIRRAPPDARVFPPPLAMTVSGRAGSRRRGADGETRTHTAFAATPSRWCVYQFHHVGDRVEFYPLSAKQHRRMPPTVIGRPLLARRFYLGMSVGRLAGGGVPAPAGDGVAPF